MKTREAVASSIEKSITYLNNRYTVYRSPKEVRDVLRRNKKKLFEKFSTALPENAIGLDIGAGDGMMSELAKPIKLVALDRYPQRNGEYNGDYTQSDSAFLPFADNHFDFVTMLYALHHFNLQHHAFHEAARVLKPGGLFILKEEHLRFPGQSYLAQMNDRISNKILNSDNPNNAPKFTEHIHYLSPTNMHKLINAAGLNILEHSISPPIHLFEIFYKTQKHLYIMKKKIR